MSGPSTPRTYRPVRQLARGGMGQVEIVVRREGNFQRVYALKRLHAHYADDPDVRAMFVDEARLAGLIRHANAVSVLDVGEDRHGPFLVMDYVDGPSVSRLADVAAERGLALPLPVVIEIVRQAALGLHAAHELRSPEGLPLDVVHRDVSPQNLLVGFDGTVRVTDFGVARAIDRITQTDVGCLKGKVGYMSPEQLRFAPLDRRSDIFSLGVVLFELCAGERLYAGDRAVVFRRILEEPAPSLRARGCPVSADLDGLVLAMLAKDPAARPRTAREVASRLDRALREEGGAVDLASFLERSFPDEHERQRAFVAEALTSGEADSIAAPRERPAPAPKVSRKVSPEASTVKGKLAMAAASLVLLGGAFALAYVVALELGTDRAEPPVPTVGAPLPAAVPLPAPPAPAVSTTPPPIAGAAGSQPTTQTAPEPAAPRPRRSHRRPDPDLARELPDPAPREPERGSPIPRWGWDE